MIIRDRKLGEFWYVLVGLIFAYQFCCQDIFSPVAYYNQQHIIFDLYLIFCFYFWILYVYISHIIDIPIYSNYLRCKNNKHILFYVCCFCV